MLILKTNPYKNLSTCVLDGGLLKLAKDQRLSELCNYLVEALDPVDDSSMQIAFGCVSMVL